MSKHIPDSQLQRFVDGSCVNDEATTTALHLDSCPQCSSRAVALDPLHAAFASVRDPAVPDGLVASILAEGGGESPRFGRAASVENLETFGAMPEVGWLEVAVGALMLGTAGLLAAGNHSLASLAALGRDGMLLAKLGGNMAAPVTAEPVLWLVTLSVATVLMLAAVWVSSPRAESHT